MELSRVCSRCRNELPLSAFNRMGAGHQYYCRECFREYFRDRGELHRRQNSVAKRRRIQRARQIVLDHLAANTCIDCGEHDAVVLEFDHVEGKKCAVSKLVYDGERPARILEEIARCEVRCANCHRIVTSQREGWARATGNIDDPARLTSKRRRRNLAHVYRILASSACIDCGEDDLVTLEFDHVGEKRASVLFLAWGEWSVTEIDREIAQCEIRCANCHRRITAARRTEARLSAPP